MFELMIRLLTNGNKKRPSAEHPYYRFIVVPAKHIEEKGYVAYGARCGTTTHMFNMRSDLDEFVRKNKLTPGEYYVYEFRECVRVQTVTTSCINSCKEIG